MKRKHLTRRPPGSARADRPPTQTGDLDRDVEAALAWLWEHPERWLADQSDADTPGCAA